MTTNGPEAIAERPVCGKIASWWVVVLMNIWTPILMVLETVVALVIWPVLLLIWRVATNWPLGKIMRHFIWMYGRVWSWIISPFVRIEMIGATPQRFPSPSVIVVNHLSFFDIFLMGQLPVFDVVICLRSWPFKMVWFAPFMRAGEYLDIERMPWEDIVAKTGEIFAQGRSIMLFPQGHRSRDGRLGRFYSGAFKLALQWGVPIVPLCITGSDRVLPPGRHWMAPGHIRVECLDPVETTGYQADLGHVELRKHVKDLMGACIAKNQS